MPQMAPMNWLTLMFYFSMIYLIFNSMNYFSFNYNFMISKTKSLLKIQNNWKW